MHFKNGICMSNIHVARQAQQKKADGLPDPNKREGPVKTAQDIYEEKGLGVIFCMIPCCNVPIPKWALACLDSFDVDHNVCICFVWCYV